MLAVARGGDGGAGEREDTGEIAEGSALALEVVRGTVVSLELGIASGFLTKVGLGPRGGGALPGPIAPAPAALRAAIRSLREPGFAAATGGGEDGATRGLLIRGGEVGEGVGMTGF